MNALKHMEAIFIAAVVVVSSCAFASDAHAAPAAAKAPAAAAAAPAAAAAAAAKNVSDTVVKFAHDGKMAIVTITAKRLVAVAKAQVR
jgi:outer membrane lipoprotein-sorting protein